MRQVAAKENNSGMRTGRIIRFFHVQRNAIGTISQRFYNHKKNCRRSVFVKTKLKMAPIPTLSTPCDLRSLSVPGKPVKDFEWDIYFPNETYKQSSVKMTQIKAFKEHIVRHSGYYNLQKIQQQKWFFVSAEVILDDCRFLNSWTSFIQELKETPFKTLSYLELAMHHVLLSIPVGSDYFHERKSTVDQYVRKKKVDKLSARPVGFFGLSRIADITRGVYSKLVVVHGRVSYIVAVETKCAWFAFKCKRCGHEEVMPLQIEISTKILRCQNHCKSKIKLRQLRSSPHTRIENKHLLLFDECGTNSDFQIEIQLRDDMLNLVNVGSEVTITGYIKAKSVTEACSRDEVKDALCNDIYIEAVSIITHENHNRNFIGPMKTDLDLVNIIAREPNCLRLLLHSIAPEICGHEMIKFAILLSMFGGCGPELDSGSGLNVLLVGDAGMRKSFFLSDGVHISKEGQFTSISHKKLLPVKKTHLTNTINVTDAKSLHLCFMGPCSFDDMELSTSNQVILVHSIQSKSLTERHSRLYFNLPVKVSLMAGINSKEGHYDSSKDLCENVRLDPSFISLFHLILVINDKVDKDRDIELVEHVNALHAGLIKNGFYTNYDTSSSLNEIGQKKVGIQTDNWLKSTRKEHLDLLPKILINKYVALAKRNCKPYLSKGAAMQIKEFYLKLRGKINPQEQFCKTTRKLQGLILVSQARARMEFCSVATKQHIDDAIEIILSTTEIF